MNRRIAFGLAVLAQFAFLGWMVASQERALRVGRRVVLSIEPFDPIDPLSGRYLAIAPRAGRIDLAEVENWFGAGDPAADATSLVGQEIDVTLTERGGEWIPARVEIAGSAPGSEIRLRGRVLSAYGSTIVVAYGLDRFYIPADAADPSPLLWQEGRHLSIEVRVTSDGHALIQDLLIDGEPFSKWNAAQKPK